MSYADQHDLRAGLIWVVGTQTPALGKLGSTAVGILCSRTIAVSGPEDWEESGVLWL